MAWVNHAWVDFGKPAFLFRLRLTWLVIHSTAQMYPCRDTSSFRLYEHVALCRSERGDLIRFIRGGSGPKSNPSPFYVSFFTEEVPFGIASDLLPNGTPFTNPLWNFVFSTISQPWDTSISALGLFTAQNDRFPYPFIYRIYSNKRPTSN